MIKETPIEDHRRYYNELREKSEKDFSFHEESNAFDNVLDFATNMVTFESKDYVRGNHLFQFFDEKAITEVIDKLNEGKFNLIILDNKRETYNMREKYYDTEYDELDFPENYRKLWNERKANPNFFLEKTNPFKPENFEIFEIEEETPVSLIESFKL
jgi:secreted Zn-dependent insulinase-like peptidase